MDHAYLVFAQTPRAIHIKPGHQCVLPVATTPDAPPGDYLFIPDRSLGDEDAICRAANTVLALPSPSGAILVANYDNWELVIELSQTLGHAAIVADVRPFSPEITARQLAGQDSHPAYHLSLWKAADTSLVYRADVVAASPLASPADGLPKAFRRDVLNIVDINPSLSDEER